MIKRRCAWCKRIMEFKMGESIRSFCSKQCYSMDREKRFANEDSGPPMKPLTAKDITDEGFIALVEAIVARAGEDVTHFAPGTQNRVSAENFFKSDFFSALTGLEGEPVLRELQEEYAKRKHRLNREKKKAFVTRRVRCIETNTEYESIKSAAEVYGITQNTLYCALNGFQKTAAGLHWEYVEDET